MSQQMIPQALVLIDVQEGFSDPSWGKRNNPQAEANIQLLLNWFRSRNWPVIHVQHLSAEPNSPLRPERPGVRFMEFAAPLNGESVFQKSVNSAFIGTSLDAHLRSEGIGSIVMVGFTTDHCVSTSARMAANLGYKVKLIADAIVAFERRSIDGQHLPAELVHQVSLASLQGEFATVLQATSSFVSAGVQYV
jgi:nicotinamidase-related amidase